MTFTQTVKGIFTRTPKDAVDNSSNGGAKRFLSKISGAFMLPISVMAIAGLFLGVGAALDSHTDAHTFGIFIKNLGDPVFGAMPALFMIAIIISFTDDIGVAVFAGVVAFLVFNAIQIPFIHTSDIKDGDFNHLDQFKDSAGIEHKTAFVLIDPGSSDLQSKMYMIIGKNLGIVSLNTSVFGGIIVGFVVSWAYKVFHEVELPSLISFFGGKRFVAFASIILMIPLAFGFMLVWPWIGLGLAYFGEYSGKVAGLDSFIFGVVERSLIPFGLHHVFYAPLWWTSAGGDFAQSYNDWADASHFITAFGGTTKVPTGTPATMQVLDGSSNGITAARDYFTAALKGSSQDKVLAGDSTLWVAASGVSFDDITYTVNGVSHTDNLYTFIDQQLGINLGRFMQGKFSFMQLGLPAAGAAMVMAAPKENRKQAAAIVFPAALTSFVTGVTEPIEFTFVFLAPALFWGFHALMAGLSFLFMNLLGAHVGMTFSGGIIDTIVYGIIPMAKGTNFYWMYLIGAILAPIYYFVFYWWIKHFDLTTPGRGSDKLFTKADYKSAKAGEADPQAVAIIEAYGGRTNLVKTANCATRLRFDVKDASKVSEDKLKVAGAMGVMKVSNTHVQAIFGPKAEVIHGKVKKALASMGANVAVVEGTVPTGPAKKTTAKRKTTAKK